MTSYLAVGLIVGAAVLGAFIDALRQPGTPRHWRRQVPTLIVLALGVAALVAAGAGL